MNKLNNLTAIAQPISETQAETVNGGSVWGLLVELGKSFATSPTKDYYYLSVKRANGGLTEPEKQQFFAYRNQYGSPYQNAVNIGLDPNAVIV